MKEYYKKEVAFERVLFFSDAVVAIAITLLALDLKLDLPEGHHITFSALLLPWHNYLAFVLSFINVASFWRAHHDFFIYIHKMDNRMMALNTCWLFCIITLPFCTSLLSTHFGDSPAVFLYSVNFFLLSIFQNTIWDYADDREGYINKERMNPEYQKRLKLMLNLDMINGLIAVVVSLFFPKTAFFLLFFKIPIFVMAAFYIGLNKRKEMHGRKNSE